MNKRLVSLLVFIFLIGISIFLSSCASRQLGLHFNQRPVRTQTDINPSNSEHRHQPSKQHNKDQVEKALEKFARQNLHAIDHYASTSHKIDLQTQRISEIIIEKRPVIQQPPLLSQYNQTENSTKPPEEDSPAGILGVLMMLGSISAWLADANLGAGLLGMAFLAGLVITLTSGSRKKYHKEIKENQESSTPASNTEPFSMAAFMVTLSAWFVTVAMPNINSLQASFILSLYGTIFAIVGHARSNNSSKFRRRGWGIGVLLFALITLMLTMGALRITSLFG